MLKIDSGCLAKTCTKNVALYKQFLQEVSETFKLFLQNSLVSENDNMRYFHHKKCFRNSYFFTLFIFLTKLKFLKFNENFCK